MSRSFTLAELAEQSGLAARTIRFYIARGLVDGPVKAGRGAVYTEAHLARLQQIQALQAEGRTLAEITHALSDSPEPVVSSPAATWHQHLLDEDVMVFVRADASPWRMKQIRAAIDTLAAQLKTERKE